MEQKARPSHMPIAAVALLSLCCCVKGVSDFDANRDFSAGANPGGVWSYGWKGTATGAFNLVTQPWAMISDNGTQVRGWNLPVQTQPAVYRNGTASSAVFGGGTAVVAPGGIWIHPGVTGRPENLGVLRFTAPSNGNYNIAVTAAPLYSPAGPAGDTDFHVVVGGSELFSVFLSRTSGTNYIGAVALEAGQTLEFAVGRGADADEYGSALKLTIVVTPITNGTAPPSILSLTPSQIVNAGASAAFHVDAGGTEPLRYQWVFNGVEVSGANSSTVSIPSVQVATAGEYSVIVTNVAGAVTSSVVTLALIPRTDFDANRDFSPGVNPGGVWSYGWKGTATGAFNLVTQPWAMISDNGTQVRGWNLPVQTQPAVYRNGTASSAVFGGGTAVVAPGGIWIHPGVTGRPENLGVLRFTAPSNGNYNIAVTAAPLYSPAGPAGDTDFHVVAGDGELLGVFLSRTSGTNYAEILALNMGQTLDFAVGRGADGDEYGSALKLTVAITPSTDAPPAAVPPSIVSLTPNLSVNAGSPASFTVLATGTAPLSYQWRLNGAAIGGVNSSTVAIASAQPETAGEYSVIVTNVAGAVTSSVVTLALIPRTDFDANRDFSPEVNPGGVWSYGWKGTATGAFNLVTQPWAMISDNGTQVRGWNLPVQTQPAVYRNGTASSAVFGGGTAVVAPGRIWIHPGVTGRPENLGVLRFTAPSNGNYNIAVTAAPLYSAAGPAGDTDFHVVAGGSELFSVFLSRTAGTNYTGVVALGGGQTLDFAVGRGADGNEYGSALKLTVALTPTTNDPTVVTNVPPETVVHPDFNVGRDFGLAANQSGVWSYGWKGTLDGAFGALNWRATPLCDNGVPVTGWLLNGFGQPAVYCNTSGGVGITGGGQGVMPPQTVWAHPGINGRPENFSVIRFTAPSNGNYEVNTALAPVYSGSLSGDSDFHLVKNGTELLGRFMGEHESMTFTTVLALSAGDALDFAFGRGTDGNEYGSQRRIAAVITPTTNPPTVITNAPPEPQVMHSDFNVGRDFGVSANPSGAWSYGWKETSGGVFGALNWRVTPPCENGVPVTGWFLSSYGQPAVYCNTSSSDGVVGGGQGVLPSQTVWAHPGINGRTENFSVIRFTAPSNCNYEVNTSLTPVYSGSLAGDADFHLVKNGVELLGRFMGSHEAMSFTNVIALNSGDVLDFAFGRGADGNEYGSGRRVAAVITPTTNDVTVITNSTPDPTNQPPAVPVIVTQPALYQSAYVGGLVSFLINVSGTPPLNFQWLFNGASIPGATSPTLVVSNVQLANAGTYRVIVGNAAGSVTSDASTLNVLQTNTGGTITFANGSYNRIYDVGGVVLVPAGGSFVAALFAGPDAGSLQQAGGPASFFLAGRFSGGTRSIPSVQPGHTAFVQIKVWDSVYGSTYEAAVAAGARHGVSPLFQTVLGGGLMPPTTLAAMPSFSLNAPAVSQPQIALQPFSRAVFLGEDSAFSVTASGGALTCQWFRNGAIKPGATLASLNLPHTQKIDAGDYSVVVQNGAGSVTSHVATLTVDVVRTLAVTSPPDSTEGALVSVPITIESDGGIGAMTFSLHYNADLLSSPEVVWDSTVSNGVQTVAFPDVGEVLASFVLADNAVSSGTQAIALVQFRARTVATNSTTDLLLDLIEVATDGGAPLPFGNDVRNGTATVLPGSGLVGDNNGNGVLDVGDATLSMRLLAQLDSSRPWDASRNDVNLNSSADSGDVIAILNAAAQIETESSLVASKAGGVPEFDAGAGLLSPGVARGSNGMVTFQIRLASVRAPVSGVSFTLSYPPAALRIAGPQSLTTGSLVPYASPVVWNVAPTNNYGQQAGRVRFVASSASSWPTNNGILAEITFEIQPASTDQYAWPLSLSSMEVTALGYNRPVAHGGALFVTRTPRAAFLAAMERMTNGHCRFNLSGDSMASYAIEASTDLLNWTVITNLVNTSGKLIFDDPDVVNFSRRFYRSRPIVP